MELNKLSKRTKELDVDLGGGDSVRVNYYVHYLTEANAKHMMAMKEDEQRTLLRYTLDMMCMMIASWDVTTNGKPFPLDPDKLAEAGWSLDMANLVIAAINRDIEVPKAS